jgi:allantoate deiminase
MNLRRDALCAAAEFISQVEAFAQRANGLVATVGQIAALPGASNVIPGEVRLSLDIRHAKDAVRERAVAKLKQKAAQICHKRKIKLSAELVHQTAQSRATDAFKPSRQSRSALSKAFHSAKWCRLDDAAAMAAITSVAMLFVRCKGGISHHPDESARLEDAGGSFGAVDFIERFAAENST